MTVPLCRNHHAGLHRHGRAKFEKAHDIDLFATIERLRARPRVTVQDGWFIAHTLLGSYFPLCRIHDGLKKAISLLKQIRHDEVVQELSA